MGKTFIRIAFLKAIESTWNPSPLVMLEDATTAMKNWLSASDRSDVPEQDYWRFSTGLTWSDFSNPTRIQVTQRVRSAILKWHRRSKFDSADTWVLDAAIQTVAFAAFSGDPRPYEWIYETSRSPRFTPKIEGARWLGSEVEPWTEFKKGMRQQLLDQLKAYRKRVEDSDRDPSKEEIRDASWLARYMGGESYDSIADTLQYDDVKTYRRKSLVSVNVARYAKRIGITLPARGRGRRPGSRTRREQGLLKSAPQT